MRPIRTIGGSLLLLAMTALGQGVGPPTPTNLSAMAVPIVSPPTVLLDWEVPEGFWLFRVYRSVADSQHFQLAGTTSLPMFIDAGLLPRTVYYYAVTTVDSALRESPKSRAVSVLTTEGIGSSTAVVRGVVKDSLTGSPLAQMSVKFIRTSSVVPGVFMSTTDSQGRYVAVLDTGTYIARVDQIWLGGGLPEYRPIWYPHAARPGTATPLHLAQKDTFTADFAVARRGPDATVHVRGTVKDTAGAPVSGATVAFVRTIQDMHWLYATTGNMPGLGDEARLLPDVGLIEGVMWAGVTDAGGNYEAELVKDVAYLGMVLKQGYLPSLLGGGTDPMKASPFVARNDTAGVDVVLTPLRASQGTVSGQVKSVSGQPVVSRVILFPRPNGSKSSNARQASTDQSGAYTIGNVETGSYSVMAVPYAGYAAAYSGPAGSPDWESAQVLHVADNAVEADVVVEPVQSIGGTELSGRVASPAAVPIQGATVTVTVAGAAVHKPVGFTVTGEGGYFSVPALPAGQLLVTIGAPGYSTLVRQITAPELQFSFSGGEFSLTPSTVVGVAQESSPVSAPFLDQNFPNPFNPATTIAYSVAVRGLVRITVHDVLGRVVATLVDEIQPAGRHTVVFQPTEISSGTYFYRLQVAGYARTRCMMLLH